MNKATEEFSFKFYKNFNVELLSDYIKSYDKEWQLDTSRQKIFDVHKHTETYFIHEHSLLWKVGDKHQGKIISNDTALVSLVWPIVEDLEKFYDGKAGQVILVKLGSFSSIDKHKDYGEYLIASRRNHIPITTNLNNTFTVDKDTISMKQGECWEINNSKTHSVQNNSNEDRIHLIVDIIPNKYIGDNNV